MTETPAPTQEKVTCRHCGKSSQQLSDNPDWLCPKCDHYQDTMACPTCGQPTRISLMQDESMIPPDASQAKE
jgi:rubrerythrin